MKQNMGNSSLVTGTFLLTLLADAVRVTRQLYKLSRD